MIGEFFDWTENKNMLKREKRPSCDLKKPEGFLFIFS